MRRFLKLTAVSTGVIIVLVGAAAVTLPLWLPVEKIKTFIISEVKHRTGRDMTAGTLKINIFQGLELSDVSIKETSKYPGKDFISDKKMLIKYSLPALLNKTLLITEIQFDSPIVTVIKGKDGLFNYSDIMTALMPQKENGNEKVETPILPAGKKDFFKSVILTGLNIKNGIFKYIDYSREKPLEVTLNNLNFYTENLILTMVKPINVSMSFEAVYNTYHIPVEATGKVVLDLKNKNFDLTLTKTTAAGMPCSGTITLRDFRDVFGELYTDIGYNDLLKFTSETVRKKMKDNNISGELKIKNKFTFKNEKQIYSQQNSTKVENGFITYKDKKVVENISSNIYLNPDFTMKGDLKCLLAGSSVNAAFTATDIRTLPNGKVEAVIDSPKFVVEYLLALLPEKDTTAQSKTPKVIAPAEKIKTNQFATVHLKLTAGALVYKTLETGKVLCEISYKAAKLYVTTQIEAYQGKLLSDISVDLNKTSYSAGFSCDKVEVNKLVENVIAIMPKKETEKNNLLDDMKGKVFGTLNMKFKLGGETFEDIAHTVKGDGSFVVANGVLKNLQMAKDLYAKTNAEFFKKDINFDTMSASFKLGAGKIEVKDFKIESGTAGKNGDARIRANGYMTMDKTLDFKVQMDLNPRVGAKLEEAFSKNLKIGDISYAYNSDGWLPFDFRVFNTMEDKKYDYNQPRMYENVKKNLGKKIEEEGVKLFNKLKKLF